MITKYTYYTQLLNTLTKQNYSTQIIKHNNKQQLLNNIY